MSKIELVNKPFDKDVLKKAKEIIKDYHIVMHEKNSRFHATSLEMPGVLADGKSVSACYKMMKFGLETAVATMLELGQRAPDPVNIYENLRHLFHKKA